MGAWKMLVALVRAVARREPLPRYAIEAAEPGNPPMWTVSRSSRPGAGPGSRRGCCEAEAGSGPDAENLAGRLAADTAAVWVGAAGKRSFGRAARAVAVADRFGSGVRGERTMTVGEKTRMDPEARRNAPEAVAAVLGLGGVGVDRVRGVDSRRAAGEGPAPPGRNRGGACRGRDGGGELGAALGSADRRAGCAPAGGGGAGGGGSRRRTRGSGRALCGTPRTAGR